MRALKFLAWCFLFLMLAAVGLGVWCWKSWAGGSTRAATPEQILSSSAGIVLPASARNVQAQEKALMVLWVLGRFDLPDEDLAALLIQTPRAPKLASLQPDREKVEQLSKLGGRPSWWQLGELRDPRYAEQTGIDTWPNGSRWEWVFRVCAGAIDEKGITRVYVAYSEEPTSPVAPPGSPATDKRTSRP